jgi:hypothetical protein
MPKWDRMASAILATTYLAGAAVARSSSSNHPARTVAPPSMTAVSPTTGPTSPTSGTSAPTSGPSSSAEVEVRTNWTTFFTGPTPAATRIARLQNGASFCGLHAIEGQHPPGCQG